MAGKGSKTRVRKFKAYQDNYANIRGFSHNNKLAIGKICDYCGKYIDPDNAIIWSLTSKEIYCSDICFEKSGAKE